MATCYPGGGAKYIKHVDNPDDNGRRLTLILYLNPHWQPGDGGELRIYLQEGEEETHCDVAPIMNRAVLFWADRVPHEASLGGLCFGLESHSFFWQVLPSFAERYAITLWYYDGTPEVAAAAIQQLWWATSMGANGWGMGSGGKNAKPV